MIRRARVGLDISRRKVLDTPLAAPGASAPGADLAAALALAETAAVVSAWGVPQ